MTLIAVVLNGHQSHYSDTKAMFDFGFRNFQSLKAVDYETRYRSVENDMTIAGMTARDSISLELDKNGRVVIPKAGDFADVQSMLTYDLDGQSPLDAVACIDVYKRQGTHHPVNVRLGTGNTQEFHFLNHVLTPFSQFAARPYRIFSMVLMICAISLSLK